MPDSAETVVVPTAMRPFVVIGPFDGLLPQSVAIVDEVVAAARAAGAPAVAIVVNDAVGSRSIMAPRRRCELLVQRGVTRAHVVDVDDPGVSGPRVAAVTGSVEACRLGFDPILEPSLRVAVLRAMGLAGDERCIDHAGGRADHGARERVVAALDTGDVAAAATALGRPHEVAVILEPRPAGGATAHAVAEPIDPSAVVPAAGRYLVEIRSMGRTSVAMVTIPDHGHGGGSVFGLDYVEGRPFTGVASMSFVDRTEPDAEPV